LTSSFNRPSSSDWSKASWSGINDDISCPENCKIDATKKSEK